MSENDIKKAASHCATEKLCDGCPLNDSEYRCVVYFAKYIAAKENEPAPAATETSSEVSSDDTHKLTHLDDNTLLDICQEALLNIAVKITVINNSDEYIQGYATAVVDVLDRLRGGI